MSTKRKRDTDDVSRDFNRKKNKANRGFNVGPDNLPDGAYKRKAKKIKHGLIERAHIKKEYAKVKQERLLAEQGTRLPPPSPPDDADAATETAEPSNAPHPDRQTLIDEGPEAVAEKEAPAEHRYHKRRSKSTPFKREYEEAQQRRTEAEERRNAREEAERQRQEKQAHRERFRKAMAKAHRGGPNGQKKLGRESMALLEKVKRMVDESG